MYESVTYEKILKRMLSTIDSKYDTREGSIIYSALAPAAVELQNMYIELDVILNEAFADTASREYLIKRAAERGLSPIAATYAVLKGEFNIDVDLGKRFSLGSLNYAVTQKISDCVYKLKCETAGAAGNSLSGTLIPIDYISGLTSAAVSEVITPGEDEEDTETFRKRYFDSISSQPFGGNITDYKQKTKTIDGVGGVKVYPAYFGGGTVRLVIINSDYAVPGASLLSSVQTAIDPTQNSGQGMGLAPIGHAVSVAGVTTSTVNIATTITYQSGWAWADVKAYAEAAIDEYFLELAKTWEQSDNLIVRISQIESRLLNISGILDVSGTTINSAAQNLTLGADSIPLRGTVSG